MNNRKNPQIILSIPEISEEDRTELKVFINSIYLNIKRKFVKLRKFEEILEGSSYRAHDTLDGQKPESFARENIIQPLFSKLGYNWTSETRLAVPGGDKDPDYILKPLEGEQFRIYVEAEPINVKLIDNPNHGMDQVEKWLFSTFATSSYGIATDGFRWVLGRLNRVTHKVDSIIEIDLTPIFQKIHNPKIFLSESEIDAIIDNLQLIQAKNFLKTTGEWIEHKENEKEEISKDFYEDYVRYVFGVDQDGNPVAGISLLSSILPPPKTDTETKNLFAVILMNRLIFIKFLEERNLVPKNLLNELFEEYQKSKLPITFYKLYLTPLFYDVLNKHPEKRSETAKSVEKFKKIPYLNGGLFRINIDKEKEFDIKNDGIDLILNELITNHRFSGPKGLNPDILGYVFEKTINFISGKGNDSQRLKGAFYTPDFVVDYITEETLFPIALSKIFNGLKKSGWKDTDLIGYGSIDDILKDTPRNPSAVKNILQEIDSISILDPACGSGHFLTSILNELLRLKEILAKSSDLSYNRYDLKWDIIAKNLYGVDVDNNSVEITRLRLWLSLIEEVKTPEHKKTLPNIDFNIISGNSLIGLLNEQFESPLIEGFADDYIEGHLDYFASRYPEKAEEIRELMSHNNLSDTISAFNLLISLYKSESGSCAEDIQRLLGKIRLKLYNHINRYYLRYLQENGDFSQDMLNDIGNNISHRIPFHWNVDFYKIMNSGGFDIVIGNPPYIEDPMYDTLDEIIIKSSRSMPNRRDRGKYPLIFATRDSGNTFSYFTERSMDLLKKEGKFGFIIPTAWLGGPRYNNFRTYLLDKKILKILTLPYDVFKVYVDNLILIVEKIEPNRDHEVKTYEFHKRLKLNKITLSNNDYFIIKQERWDTIKDKKFIINPHALAIYEKITGTTTLTFDDYIQIKRGVRFKSSLLTNSKVSENYHLYFEGDVGRYSLIPRFDQWVEFKKNMEECPKEFRWFTGERILLRRLVNRRFRLMAMLVDETFITNKNLYSILLKVPNVDLKVILGLLNSKLISYLYLTQLSQATKDDFPQITIDGVISLPIPDLISNSTLIDSIVPIVDDLLLRIRMLIETENQEERISLIEEIAGFDNQVDEKVFELYNLNQEDIHYINLYFDNLLQKLD